MLKFVFLGFFIDVVICFNDYYWRDYTGKIPFDAVPGGQDVNNEETYIGQAFIKDQGIFPTTLYSDGNKAIYVPIVGAKTPENFMQILCSTHQEFFKWVPANKTHLHLMTQDDNLVRGGIERNQWVNIGRVKYEGDMVMGKVLSGMIGDALMYFAHKNSEKVVGIYEVLTFDGSSIQELELRIGPV